MANDVRERPAWYFLDFSSDAHQGPVHATALATARLVWREGMAEWLPPGSVPEVVEALARYGVQPAPSAHACGSAAPSAPTPTRWYYQRVDGAPEGPLGVGDLQAAMLSGDIDGMTTVWAEGMPAWLELREVPSLRALFQAAQETLRAAEPEAEADDDGEVPTERTGSAPAVGAQRGAAGAAGAELAEQPAAGAPGTAGAADGARKRKRPAKRFKAHNPNSIYVSNLPACIRSEEDLARLFEPCGVLKLDSVTGAKKAKLYRDEAGRLKGDGVVTFARKESVQLAVTLRDKYVVPSEEPHAAEQPHGPISVQPARFEAKGAFAPTQKSKDELEAAKKARVAERRALAEWEEGTGLGGRGTRVVILKGVWTPEEVAAVGAEEQRAFYENLRADVHAECAKCGPVEKVSLFEGSPIGAAAVKFRSAAAAEVCQALMHGRRFGGHELAAEFFDGTTNYKVAATSTRPRAERAGGAAGPGAVAAGAGGQPDSEEEEEEDGDGEEALDSHAEQQRRLEAMAAQLDAQSSDEGSDSE